MTATIFGLIASSPATASVRMASTTIWRAAIHRELRSFSRIVLRQIRLDRLTEPAYSDTMAVALAETLSHLQAVARSRAAKVAMWEAEVRAKLPAAAALLRAEFGATDIYLFGSLAGGKPHERSDVDIATLGIAAKDESRVWNTLEEIFGCPVDLVRIESAPESLLGVVRLYGEPL